MKNSGINYLENLNENQRKSHSIMNLKKALLQEKVKYNKLETSFFE